MIGRYRCKQTWLVIGLRDVVVLEDGLKLLIRKHSVVQTLAAREIHQR